ncbi:hypothetical protein HYW21_04025 [Candidatus Woesearchaeota archaeon]|nr:hypothetical protein [Candidatus Woesearchaeota archaeon]
MKKSVHKLLQKGWSPEEIKTVLKHWRVAEARKHPSVRFLDASAYWFFVVILFFVHVGLQILLFPFLLSFPSLAVLLVILVLGIPFGYLTYTCVEEMKQFTKKKHVERIYVIPLIFAVITLSALTVIANKIKLLLHLQTSPQSIVMIVVVYVVSFILPFLLHEITLQKAENTPSNL